jgi:hypothetical protein
LFLVAHRRDLGTQQAKFVDSFGEDDDFFTIGLPLFLDVWI